MVWNIINGIIFIDLAKWNVQKIVLVKIFVICTQTERDNFVKRVSQVFCSDFV